MLLARTLTKPHSALIVVWLCLHGVYRAAAAPGKNSPSSDVALASQSTESMAARLATQNALFKAEIDKYTNFWNTKFAPIATIGYKVRSKKALKCILR